MSITNSQIKDTINYIVNFFKKHKITKITKEDCYQITLTLIQCSNKEVLNKIVDSVFEELTKK